MVRRQNGFTLIELMVCVAIVGILASIAIPNFLKFQKAAKSTEGKVNIAAIRTAEVSYEAEFGRYVAAAVNPTTALASEKQPWTPSVDFDRIGWAPTGNVYFNYAVAVVGQQFTIDAQADIDGDGIVQSWGYFGTDASGNFTPGRGQCTTGTGEFGTDLDTVGPCFAEAGRSIF